MKSVFLAVLLLFSFGCVCCASTPTITAEQWTDHARGEKSKKAVFPETVLICHGVGAQHLLDAKGPFLKDKHFPALHILPRGKVGILSDIGAGSSALAHEMERLIACGTKRFVLVGTASSLCNDLPTGTFILCSHAVKKDDSLSVLYASQGVFSEPSKRLYDGWLQFTCEQALPCHPATSWTFPSFFLQTPSRVQSAKNLGCAVVEMETATLYSLAQAKDVEAVALFVVSDRSSEEGLNPTLEDEEINGRVRLLSEAALIFCNGL